MAAKSNTGPGLPAGFAHTVQFQIKEAIDRVLRGSSAGSVEGLTETCLVGQPDSDLTKIPFVVFGTGAPFVDGQFAGYLALSVVPGRAYPLSPPDFYFMTENGLFGVGKGASCVSIGSYHASAYPQSIGLFGFVSSIAGIFLDPDSLGSGINVIYHKSKASRETASRMAAASAESNMRDPLPRAIVAVVRDTYPDYDLRCAVMRGVSRGESLEAIRAGLPELAGVPLRHERVPVSVLDGCRRRSQPIPIPAARPAAGGGLGSCDSLEDAFGAL